MGILDAVKKAARGFVKFIPGVGPVADTVLDVLDVAGDYAEGRAAGRQAAAATNADRDRLATDQYGIQQRSYLDAADGMARQNLNDAQLGLAAPSMRGRQALMGDALANFQYRVPTHARANVVDFGSPVNLSASTRELGRALSSGALADQREGNSPLEKVDYLSMLLDSPGQTPLPEASRFDRFLETAGAVGRVGKAIRGEDPDYGNQRTTARSIAEFAPPQTGVPNVGTPASISAPPWRTGRVPGVRFGGQ